MPISSNYDIEFYSAELGSSINLITQDTMLSDDHIQFGNERNISVTDLVDSPSPHVKDTGNVVQTLAFTAIHRYSNIEDFQSDTINANEVLSKIKIGKISVSTIGGYAKQWDAVCRRSDQTADVKRLKIEISYEFVLNSR